MGTPKIRAVGVVRVSRTAGREGETFHSPHTQRERIQGTCSTRHWELLEVHEELDVSGGRALAKRHGLLAAVLAVEQGRADVVVAAYLDRLTRDPRVRDEVVDRVEAAGGEVWAVDMGRQTNGTAAEQLTGTMASAVHRYVRRVAAERSAEAQARAVARGVAPYPIVIPGLRRQPDGILEPDPQTAPIVAEAVRLRAEGKTITQVRAYLAANGIQRSFQRVQALLGSRVLLGEIAFGDLVNREAHEPIVDVEVWKAAQRTQASRGRYAKSERLLARLEVLRCATCDARMVVGSKPNRRGDRVHHFYRCPTTGDCPRRVSISALLVEGLVATEVRRLVADVEGTANAAARARQTVAERDAAQAVLDKGIRNLADVEDEPAARARLAELRADRDAKQTVVDRLGPGQVTLTISGSKDWDVLTLDERRALIRSVILRVTVAPGSGLERVAIETVGQ